MAGESYFIKEIRSMERIIRQVETSRPVLAVIDEILRGTNTRERIAASTAVLRYLREKGCLVIAATHDLEIAENLVSQAEDYEDFYFCEETCEKGLTFDYKIHRGSAARPMRSGCWKSSDFQSRSSGTPGRAWEQSASSKSVEESA